MKSWVRTWLGAQTTSGAVSTVTTFFLLQFSGYTLWPRLSFFLRILLIGSVLTYVQKLSGGRTGEKVMVCK
jgi:hypothetical protein